MSSISHPKQNPFQRSNPFYVPNSVSINSNQINKYYQPSSFDQPLQQNYKYNNYNVSSYQIQSKGFSYEINNAHKNNQSIQLPLSIKQNSYLKYSKLDNQMWRFHEDNCNKTKVFNGNQNTHLQVSNVDKNIFEKELTLSNLRKRQKTMNQQQQKHQKIIQNPFNRKYLVSANVNNLAQSFVYVPPSAKRINNDGYQHITSNVNIKPQAISSYNNININYDYQSKKSISANNYNYNEINNYQVNDNSIKINHIESNWDIENRYANHDNSVNYTNNQSKNGSIRNIHLPPQHPSSQTVSNKMIQSINQKRSIVSRNSRDSRASKHSQSNQKVKFEQSDQEQTPRMRKQQSVKKLHLSKQQILNFQSGPEIIKIRGITFYKQQILSL